MWLALRQAGRASYVQMIGEGIRLSEQLYELVNAHPAFEALTQGLSITTFRYVPEDLRIQRSGEAFVSNAVVRGRYALRSCIVNFNTALADIEALPAIIEGLDWEADEALRSGILPTERTG